MYLFSKFSPFLNNINLGQVKLSTELQRTRIPLLKRVTTFIQPISPKPQLPLLLLTGTC